MDHYELTITVLVRYSIYVKLGGGFTASYHCYTAELPSRVLFYKW